MFFEQRVPHYSVLFQIVDRKMTYELYKSVAKLHSFFIHKKKSILEKLRSKLDLRYFK